ncbi:MAG: rob [Proteobacteria bacterium]|nr:rob [Pseudomonadota bacterium]
MATRVAYPAPPTAKPGPTAMRMSIELFSLQSRRIRSVIEYVGTHLDEDISLARLADLACLSPSQLERLYRSKVGETPITTLRRLRLQRALAEIRAEQVGLQDIGLAAGYGSAAAFTHAFVRQFGFAPSQVPVVSPQAEPLPPLQLEYLPATPTFQVPYAGQFRERFQANGVLVGSLAVAGAKRWRNWTVLPDSQTLWARADTHVNLVHFVPASGQPDTVPNVERGVQGGGLYAVWHTRGFPRRAALPRVIEEIRSRHACLVREGASMLLREITVSGYTAPQERRFALYLPVVPHKRRS